MKTLLRSTFIVNQNDSKDKDLLLQNFHNLKDSDLTVADDDAPIWKYIQRFVNDHKHVPEVGTMRQHFDHVNDDQAIGRLDGLATIPAVTAGDFLRRLFVQEDKAMKGRLHNLLKDAATILTSGMEVNDHNLQGPAATLGYLAEFIHKQAEAEAQGKRVKVYQDLNERYVYLTQRGDVYDRQLQSYLPLDGFKRLGPSERYWISPKKDGARTTRLNVTFEPNVGKAPDHLLNLFDATVLARQTKTVKKFPEPFVELLLNLANGDPEDAEYIASWLAYALQNPGKKMVALVLHGAKGTGKGLLADLCSKLFGRYAVLVTNSMLESRFNPWLGQCILALANEVSTADMRDKKAVEYKLNAWITDNRLTIEPKGHDTYEIPNYTKWLFTSNDTVPVLVQPGDRRFSVVFSPLHLVALNGRAGSNPTLPATFVAALQDPTFVQEVADLLLSMDTAARGFSPYQPHANASRDAVQSTGLSGCGRFWQQVMPPAGDYPDGAIRAAYQAWCVEQNEKVRPMAALLQHRPDNVTPKTFRKADVALNLRGYCGFGANVHGVRVADVGQGGNPAAWPQSVLPRDPHPVAGLNMQSGVVYTFPEELD
jgi:hypothetical protein